MGAPEQIGPFEVEGILGSGGMGVVYRAAAPGGLRVALKVLSKRAAPDDLLRFQREAQIHIDHPNVVRTIDAGIDTDGTRWIAFELLEGRSLDRELEPGPLQAMDVREVGLQACEGLAAAHALRVIHRDLKPANVFRTHEGIIKLLDFGVAHWASDRRLTATGVIVGTPSYLAPEQARADAPIDETTDVFGLGAVLYHALTGRPPFQRESALATLVAAAMEPIPLLVDVAPFVPPSFAAVVQRALSAQKRKRHPTAKHFRDALLDVDLRESSPERQVVEPMISAGGERRVVAVLYADGVTDVLRFERGVAAHGGRTIPLAGERSLGVFGSEHWTGDEVVMAAKAGLDVREAALRMAVASGFATKAGGVLSGEVLVAAEGAALASEGLALDRLAAQELSKEFAIVELDHGVFELGPEAPRGPARRSRLIGRRVEMATIERAVARAIEHERLEVVYLSGPPGIGKSRIASAVAELLASEGMRVFELIGRPRDGGRAYAPIARALRMAIGHSDDPIDEQCAVLALVRDALREHGDLETCACFIAELAGVAMPRTPTLSAARSDSQLMDDRLRLAIIDVLEGWVDRGPLGIVLEDTQWIDIETLAVLAEVVTRGSERPIVVLATGRPELDPSSIDLFRRAVSRVDLLGLGDSEVVELIREMAADLDDERVSAIAKRCEGNPLFAEELVHAPIAEASLPLTIEAAVQAHLHVLPPPERDALEHTAVFQRAVSTEELEAIGIPSAGRILKALVRRNLMSSVRSRSSGAIVFRPRGEIVGEVAYRMISDDRRQKIHLLVARSLERSPDAHAEEVGRHFELGGDSSSAAAAYARAALAHPLDSLPVLRCVERAFALGIRTSAFELRMAEVEALQFLGRHEDQAAAIEAALASAATEAQRARAQTERVKWLVRKGLATEALAVSEDAVSSARASGDAEVLALALGRRGMVLANHGHLDQAAGAIIEATAISAGSSSHLRALIAAWQAHVATQRGRLEERRDAFARAASLYRASGDVRRAAGAAVNLADVENRVGAYASAEARLTEALEACRRVGNRPMEGYALVNLAYAVARRERPEQAMALLDDAEAIGVALGESKLLSSAIIYRLETKLALGVDRTDADRAAQIGDEAAASGHAGRAVFAWTVAARAYLDLGDLDCALPLSHRAIEVRDRIGSVEENEGDVFTTRAHVLERAGAMSEAAEVRARGRARILELARAIEDDEMRDSFIANVESNRELTADA